MLAANLLPDICHLVCPLAGLSLEYLQPVERSSADRFRGHDAGRKSGAKIRSDVSGLITAVRFYKRASNMGIR